MSLTIGKKFVFAFLTLLLGSFLAFSYFSLREQANIIASYARHGAIEEANVLASLIGVEPLHGSARSILDDPQELQHYIEDLHSRSDRDVVVLDHERTVLADRETRNVGTQFPHFEDPGGVIERALEQTIRDGTPGVFVEKSADGVLELVSVPVKSSKQKIVGVLILEYSHLNQQALVSIGRLRSHVAWVALGIAVIACILARGIAAQIARPIRALTDATVKLGTGDLSKRVEVTSNDETGELAMAFNAMAEQLAETTISKNALQNELADRKRLEALLRESEKTYRTLFQHSADSVFLMTDVCYDCNDAACRMLGCGKEWIVGQSPLPFSPPVQPDGTNSAERVRKCILAAKAGTPQHLYWRLQRLDGTPLDVEISVFMVTVDGKEIVQATMHDITARHRAERQLQDYAAALETSTKAKREFLANMSHEIRTPMTAILGYADLLLESVHDPRDVDAVVTIQRNGERLLRIINDILDLSKVEAGKMAIENMACSPQAILGDVTNLMRVRAHAKNLTLTLECAGLVPEKIHTDPTRLRQILVNLVGNAIKFTEVGGVKVTMELVPQRDQRPAQMCFRVADTGSGLAHELVARLFQPFSEGDASSPRNYGGTGLGLAISRQLAEALGGTITVESTPGQGSTFTVTINAGSLDGVPLVDPTSWWNRHQEETPPPPPREEVKLRCRVLLAEDGPDNQRLIDLILRRAGAETCIVENGALAVSTALAASQVGTPYDVLLMDMQMPVMDGYDATRQLRSAGYTLPIVALTAHAMSEDRQRCLDAGCDGYLTKPIDRSTLLQAVRQFASHRSWQETPTS